MFSNSSYCTRDQFAGNNVHELQRNRFKVFKEQDTQKGYYDVTFEIEGKQLYAHKFTVAAVSETMDAMLSTRWTTSKDEVIKIETHSYNSFYQFLCFLYSGDCEITEENVFQLVDIAEFYGVKCFKDFCDKFLSKSVKLTIGNIEEMTEFALKYSMKEWTQVIERFIDFEFYDLIKSENFLSHGKTFIEFVSSVGGYGGQELFEAVYKWAEHQVLKQKSDDNDGSFNLYEAIRNELINVLPHIHFCYMSFAFLMGFVVEKGFRLNPTELFKFFCRLRNVTSEQSRLENVYELAVKQAVQKQKMSPDNNFCVADSIKADLAEVISQAKFYIMEKPFLNDFVVTKGILSKEQVDHVFDTKVIIESDGKVITGVFTDDFGIYDAIQKRPRHRYETYQQNTKKIRYTCLRHATPSTPSPVQKMVGTEWYLCLENRVLTFKHHSLVDRFDFLIAEMKGDPEFQITPGKKITLTVSYRNLEGLI